MLTPKDRQNLDKFDNLSINHQRVFKHRLIKKFVSFQQDLDLILLHFERLNIKVDKIIDINQLTKLFEMYENLSKLQNM